MSSDPPFPANAIKDPFGYSGDESSVVFAPQYQQQGLAAYYPWSYDSPAPDELMGNGWHPVQQPTVDPSYTATATLDSPPEDDTTPSSPQMLSDNSDNSDSSDDSDDEWTYATPQCLRPGAVTGLNNQLEPTSRSGELVPESVRPSELAQEGRETMADEANSLYDLSGLGLSEVDWAALLPPSATCLEAGDHDPFMDMDGTDESQPDRSLGGGEEVFGNESDEEQLDTPPLTPTTLAPATKTLEAEDASETEDRDVSASPLSTRLVPGPGSTISDDEWVAAANDDVDGEGEEKIDDPPAYPNSTPAPKRATSLTSTKKTFKDGLWDAINDPAFEKDIYWAEDGLSGEIPDRRKFERSAAMRAITDARNVSGFVRQLHMWGFHRFKRGGAHSLCFTHPLFRRDEPELRHNISRKGETKYRVRKTKRRQKRGKASASSAPSPEVRKSSRSSTRRNYKEAPSPAPSSDPEVESDFEVRRPLKRRRRGEGSGSSRAAKGGRAKAVAAPKVTSASQSSSKVAGGKSKGGPEPSIPSSPEPTKPALSTIRPKTLRSRKA